MDVASTNQEGVFGGLPWQSSGLDSVLPMQGVRWVQVQTLVRELRSQMCGLKNYFKKFF